MVGGKLCYWFGSVLVACKLEPPWSFSSGKTRVNFSFKAYDCEVYRQGIVMKTIVKLFAWERVKGLPWLVAK